MLTWVGSKLHPMFPPSLPPCGMGAGNEIGLETVVLVLYSFLLRRRRCSGGSCFVMQRQQLSVAHCTHSVPTEGTPLFSPPPLSLSHHFFLPLLLLPLLSPFYSLLWQYPGTDVLNCQANSSWTLNFTHVSMLHILTILA